MVSSYSVPEEVPYYYLLVVVLVVQGFIAKTRVGVTRTISPTCYVDFIMITLEVLLLVHGNQITWSHHDSLGRLVNISRLTRG